jgi:GTP-binding protein LepA
MAREAGGQQRAADEGVRRHDAAAGAEGSPRHDTQVPQENVRNFCIVAHIDHGKSTLADRLLEVCGALEEGEAVEQVLDDMELERERGITIKASAVRLIYEADDGETYQLNLIDTPGHVDFTYEVSRSLSACEGAVLLVDVSQGVEAQTVANVYLALEEGLEIIPVANKIDIDGGEWGNGSDGSNGSGEWRVASEGNSKTVLGRSSQLATRNSQLPAPPQAGPGSRVRATIQEMTEAFAFQPDEILLTSGKTGEGVRELLEAIVKRIPPPKESAEAPLRALIFDSEFDVHQGVIAYVRIFEGRMRPGDEIAMMSSGKSFEVSNLGVFTPEMEAVSELRAGDVGYVTAGIKNVEDSRVGDTITSAEQPAAEPLPGYREVQPMVFCGLYPSENTEFQGLKDALDRLSLNDAALRYEREASAALGFGFRCGFLGLLHMEIVQERLEREYDLDLVATAPNVIYRVLLSDGQVIEVDNPAAFPERELVEAMEEPVIDATNMCPQKYVGRVIKVSDDRRGQFQKTEYLWADRVALHYRLPLAEIIVDYFDALKSATRGYATLDYELAGYQPDDLVKVDMLINGEPVDALAIICHREFAEQRGRAIARKLKEVIPRQLFEVRIQASIGRRIVASTRVRPLRKDVTGKLYGGDVTRKMKLLERQKKGKRRMKQIGEVHVPQEAFMSILRLGDQ